MASFSSLVSQLTSSVKQPAISAGAGMANVVGGSIANTKAGLMNAAGSAAKATVNTLIGESIKSIVGNNSISNMLLGPTYGQSASSMYGAGASFMSEAQIGSPGDYHVLAAMGARQDAVLNFNWVANFPPVAGVTLPWYYCETATLSWRVFETQQVYRMATHHTLPSKYSVAPLRLGFMMDDSCAAANYLAEWQNLILSRAGSRPGDCGKWGRPADFWKNITVDVLSVNKQAIMRFTYFDAWPTNLDALNLVSSGDGRLILEVDFAVNDVGYELMPVAAAQSSYTGFAGYNTNALSGLSQASGLTAGGQTIMSRAINAGLSSFSNSLSSTISNLLR